MGGLQKKNPAYGTQSISRPMRIVSPMPRRVDQEYPKNPIFEKKKQTPKTQKLRNV